jgi:hypothetical protein
MLAIEPTDSTQASDPAEPMDRMEPAEPIDKMDPLDPMDRIDPLEPMLRIDPDEPAEREEPLLIRMRPLCRAAPDATLRLRPGVVTVNGAGSAGGGGSRGNNLGGTQGTWPEHHDPFG